MASKGLSGMGANVMCSPQFDSLLAERGRLLNIAQIGTIDEAGSMTLPLR
jgi:hypothetical protein